jgi:hypothetical protein
MDKVFVKATWGQVEPDDVVLMPWTSLDQLVEVKVLDIEAEEEQADSRRLMYASLEVAGESFPRWSFNPNGVAYVKARF